MTCQKVLNRFIQRQEIVLDFLKSRHQALIHDGITVQLAASSIKQGWLSLSSNKSLVLLRTCSSNDGFCGGCDGSTAEAVFGIAGCSHQHEVLGNPKDFAHFAAEAALRGSWSWVNAMNNLKKTGNAVKKRSYAKVSLSRQRYGLPTSLPTTPCLLLRSVGTEFPARLGNPALDEKQMKKRKMDGRSSAGRLYLQDGGHGILGRV